MSLVLINGTEITTDTTFEKVFKEYPLFENELLISGVSVSPQEKLDTKIELLETHAQVVQKMNYNDMEKYNKYRTLAENAIVPSVAMNYREEYETFFLRIGRNESTRGTKVRNSDYQEINNANDKGRFVTFDAIVNAEGKRPSSHIVKLMLKEYNFTGKMANYFPPSLGSGSIIKLPIQFIDTTETDANGLIVAKKIYGSLEILKKSIYSGSEETDEELDLEIEKLWKKFAHKNPTSQKSDDLRIVTRAFKRANAWDLNYKIPRNMSSTELSKAQTAFEQADQIVASTNAKSLENQLITENKAKLLSSPEYLEQLKATNAAAIELAKQTMEMEKAMGGTPNALEHLNAAKTQLGLV